MINYFTNLFITTNIPTDKIFTYLDNIENRGTNVDRERQIDVR